MDGFPIRQQDNPKVPAFHNVDSRPAPDPTVSLDVLPLRGGDDAQNPFVLDYRTVGTRANCFKILRDFHELPCGTGASSGPSESGRLQPRHFRLELEAQLGALVLGQPERHLRENGAV
jgi:hypothetical protein